MNVIVKPLLALSLAVCAACAANREGWGRGRFLVVVESTSLQVRRSTVRVEDPTGDLVMNWIGARTPGGQPPLTSFDLTVFDDVNGDRVPQPSEVRAHRASADRTEKVIFSDIRAPAAEASRAWHVLVSARTEDGRDASNVFAFRPDR